MARVTVVKKAQQRYETVVKRDEQGNPVKVPVMKKVKDHETGEVTEVQKTSKTGRPVFRTLSVEDKTKPKPNRKCDKCGKEIKPGDPYKWIAPKSGPYGGSKRFRCGDCPSWQIWEYSGNKRAPIWQAQHEANIHSCESKEDVESAIQAFAEVVREVAESYTESADNIESGFGHETYQSSELREQADTLGSWADDLDSPYFSVSDEPEPCADHEQNVVYHDEGKCDACQELRDDWLDELRTEAEDMINEEP